MSEDKPFEFIPSKPQAEFLSSSADIIGFGGAAGSGKSLTAVIWMLGLNNPTGALYTLPYYRGIIYRIHRADLKDLIDKTKQIYPLIDPGATFNNTELTWTFSSDAKIYMKYFERFDQAETWLQGQALVRACGDEQGQMDNLDIFNYCMTRLRSAEGLKCQMAATMNPSRYKCWRELFKLDDYGTSNEQILELKGNDGRTIKKRIKWIKATLADNPNKHIRETYEGQLLMADEETKNALLYGLWTAFDTVDGLIYEHELKKFNEEYRLTTVNHDPALDVHTFFDIGISDHTVILFVQFAGKEVRIINMIKDNNKGLKDYYIPKVIEMGKQLGYRYGVHHLPHDAGAREKFGGISILDQTKEYLPGARLLPRTGLAEGIQSTKAMFPNVWIDKAKCSELHEDLSNYRREWDGKLNEFKQTPLHDKFSHSSDCFRYVSYFKKPVKLDLNGFDQGTMNPFAY